MHSSTSSVNHQYKYAFLEGFSPNSPPIKGSVIGRSYYHCVGTKGGASYLCFLCSSIFIIGTFITGEEDESDGGDDVGGSGLGDALEKVTPTPKRFKLSRTEGLKMALDSLK